MALLNAFDLAEGDVTENNYEQILEQYNATDPNIIQGLDLKFCNLNTFLSEVSPGKVYTKMFKTIPRCGAVTLCWLCV